MISQATIDSVFETARVEEVIGDFVHLKRAGSNFKGLSPFSDERSPSFMVSPAKGIWKDFSTGKGGNSVKFLMEHSHFTYPEAIRFLAKKYNIEIEETELTDQEKAITDVRESMYLVSEFAKNYFHKTLLNSEEGKAIGLSYFKERGFTNETIEKFSLGYSPETWDAFTKEALGQGYKLEFLESTGLTIPKADRPFDRFKGRVMFPIQSMSGRTLGFGGRILTNDKKAAKYLNSPESELYHKGKVLYGIFQAKQAIAKQNNCFLVEGYTDVIQFNQAGIENVVSSSGTALTPNQISLISRWTQNITVLFDGDAAGLRASIRGIDLILEGGMNVKVCTFPDGEDPDSFAKKTPYDDLVKYLEENAKDFISFKASILKKEISNDVGLTTQGVLDMVTSISKVTGIIQRESYIRECSSIMGISEQVLTDTLKQIDRKVIQDSINEEQSLNKRQGIRKVEEDSEVNVVLEVDILYRLERKIIEILLLYGNVTQEFEDTFLRTNDEGEIVTITEKKAVKVFQRIYLSLQEDEVELANPLFRGIFNDLINFYLQNENFSLEQYLMHLQPEFAQEVTDILMEDERLTLHDWEGQNIFPKSKNDTIAQNVTETIFTLRWYLVGSIIEELKGTLSAEADNTDSISMIMDYNGLVLSFSKKLGRVMSRF